MVRRCTIPTENQYVDYGGRGISVCDEWLTFAVYVAYVDDVLGPQPSREHTIDRVDNDGNYEPGNNRWATRSQQNANQRQRHLLNYPVGVAGYRGVHYHPKTGRWHARVNHAGREYSLRYHDTPEEAARAYDVAVLGMGIKGEGARLNFPAEVPE